MSLSHSPKIVTNGLVLCLDAADKKSYPGTGTLWTDRSGNISNGTLVNGVGYNSANAGYLTFNGSNHYSSLSTVSNIHNQNFTISIWIYPNIQSAQIVSIIDFDHSTSPFQGWTVQSEDATTNRNFYLAWYDGTQFQPAGLLGAGRGIQINSSVWQNIVYSKNGISLLAYKNNSQVYASTAGTATVSYLSNRNINIGRTVNTQQSRYFNGNIAQVSIYNRALSPQEITQNFNATRGRYGI